MRTTHSCYALPVLVLLVGCIDHKCPKGYDQRGDTCYRIRPDAGSDASTDADMGSVTAGGGKCYLDWDHDGAGAGQPFDCELDLSSIVGRLQHDSSTEVTSLPELVDRDDDCDDEDPSRSPELSELCDGIDNDCDDDVDDDATNGCGGPCLPALAHSPGESCTNGLAGSCAREGTYVCDGDNAVKCDAVAVTPSEEVCGDEIDNDCDGRMDEAGVDAPSWYQDCDGDGYAAATTGSIRACSKPPPSGACSWTQVLPQPETKTNWDCDDSRPDYNPEAGYGLPPAGSTSFDLNCDGILTPDPAPVIDGSPSEIFACGPSIASKLNAGERDCDPTPDFLWNGCFLWKTSSNTGATYTYYPPTRCPDTLVYRLRVVPADEVLDPWGFNFSLRHHATACRASPSRPPSHGRPLSAKSPSDRVEGKTTPGASYCQVTAIDTPVWPCR